MNPVGITCSYAERQNIFRLGAAYCRAVEKAGGMQLLNIACGGDIYQDLALRQELCLQHWQKAPEQYPTHHVDLATGTMLAQLFGEKIASGLIRSTIRQYAKRAPACRLRPVHLTA